MTVSWTNKDPSDFIHVSSRRGNQLTFLGRVDGSLQGVVVTEAQSADVIMLQFFKTVNGNCYGSELISCVTAGGVGPFIRGDCNADAILDPIADAVTLLAFNFLGEAEPRCRVACDSNSDGDIGGTADSIYLLGFFFLAGNPPPGPPFRDCGPGTSENDRKLSCAIPPVCP